MHGWRLRTVICASLVKRCFRGFCGSFFFFSSRRRHTRLQGDWSSDVCSSDLAVSAALKLNGTAYGLTQADAAVAASPNSWNFGTTAFGGTVTEYSANGLTGWQIGRASCRGRGEISGGGVLFKKKKKER